MTVRELIDELKKHPEHKPVCFVVPPTQGEFTEVVVDIGDKFGVEFVVSDSPSEAHPVELRA